MADIYEAVKSAVKQVLGSMEFCDMELGEVISLKPFKIRLTDRIVLSESQIMLTDAITEKIINLAHKHESDERMELVPPTVVRDGLKVGEKVLLLKVQNGQTYIVISRVIKP